ncbi:16S rRNA (adenine(1518)-N(6)/adenine(1519)-N(6))-dimethyltransferase RsmA [Microbaculum marinisediminis]|uniref:Ribosomal RNA small subunit methyltransferase A n=1 Tax=Microbaculum marinisediminis TaxID=2931392 RepID=A0AAW5QZ06_9HYPH|nr:16S rRNA (adenine(1518)-N(6)/adenine(1519)-N(6))-dimethyltransferase RsmA [Microbaculum sp. A6E488]MCT8973215.1 16S rRNA (adenine(1518)-N(6)/adenine(1519)-N(6))-dimethyltransferase RsmA [Microbaculum sp. A6E488]
MPDTPDLPPLREVIAHHGLAARKSLGQNFLLDINLTRRIARASGPLDGVTVAEVGPGPGGLTRALLLEGAKKVVAIEKDDRCIAALEDLSAAFPGRLEIVAADATKLDLGDRIDPPGRIVANLPYNVSTVLLVGWLGSDAWPPWWDSLTLMFQREVAERIVADAGSKTYGRLSILAQWRSSARILFDVDRRAFTPPPKITSSVVRIEPTDMPEGVRFKDLERVTAAAFGQRRKMLRSSLKSLVPQPEALLEAAGIVPTSRAEDIPVDGFLALTRAFAASA